MNLPDISNLDPQKAFDFLMEWQSFKTVEVAEATGFSIRQLDYWAREEYFVPSIALAMGCGSRRLYNFSDILQLRFVRMLMQNGWTRRESFEALKSCRAILSNPNLIEDAVFIREGKKMLAICKTREGKRLLLEAAKAGKQQVMEIVLEVLQEETLKRLAEIK